MQFIGEVSEGQRIESLAQVRSRQLRPKRNGESYLKLILADRSGRIEARMWEDFEQIADQIREGDFVRYLGRIEVYNGSKQVVIEALRKISPAHLHQHGLLKQLVPSTDKDISSMWQELLSIVDKEIEREVLKKLLRNLMDDYQEAFCCFPAGVEIHHAYLGGFLEHVLSLAQSALFFSRHYEELNRDLLIAGAIVHDIGKLRELNGPANPGYTTVGRLVGHIVLGRDILRDAAAGIPDFPGDLLIQLEHLIISHQGQLEWGSPRRPKTPEALALHYLDDLDAKLNRFFKILREDQEDSDFTAFDRYFGRFLFKGKTVLDREIPSSTGEASAETMLPFSFENL